MQPKKQEKPNIYVTNDSDMMGSYNLIEHSIGIFHGLYKFPELRKMVLEHEMKHAEEPNELFVVLKREYKDYSHIYETNAYWDYRKYYQNKELKRGIWWYIKFTYFYNWAVQLIYILMMIRGLIINRWRRWRK